MTKISYRLFFCTLTAVCLCSEAGFPAQSRTEAEQRSQATTAPANHTTAEDSSKYPDPNKIPYRSKKNLFAHLFSLPATVWRLAWTPIGATTIWVEQNRIHQKAVSVFLNDDLSGGIFPLVSLGGNTGAGVGVMAFHNNLFGRRKRVSANFLYSTRENNSASFSYSDSTFLSGPLFFHFTGSYFNDSDENLFVSADVSRQKLNESALAANQSTENDETSYATEQLAAAADFGFAIDRRIGIGITSTIKRTEIDSGDGSDDDRFASAVLGQGSAKLFAIGAEVTFDFRNGWPRTVSGTLLRIGYQLNREIDGDRYKFNRLSVEIQQFVPLPFMAKNRRLALRGTFEKLDRLSGKQIPFYELSMLGSASTLRGYDQNRFRGKGSLLFNLEYRYPVWDAWDAVLFLDEGQVFDDYQDLRLDAFHYSIGAGLRFLSARGFIARIELGYSKEMIRALFAISPNFK